MPVYELKPETGAGRTRVLHRNLLLPCNHLPLSEIVQTDLPKPRKKRELHSTDRRVPPPHQIDDGDSSDDESYFLRSHSPADAHQTTEPPAPFDSKGGVVIECKGLVVRQATQEDTDELVEPGDKTLLDLYTFYIHITYG